MAEQKKQKKNSSIPTTGRIGRFLKIVEEHSGEKNFIKIAEGSSGYNKLSAVQKALWWKNAVEKMDAALGGDAALTVMTQCGAKCCGAGHRKTARRLMESSDSVEEFLAGLEKLVKNEGDLSYSLAEDGKILARHNKCFCGQVKRSPEKHSNALYCSCSVEFNRRFFSAAFNKPVEVELKKTILCGDDYCEFEITV